jgi:hypothetical protein
MKSSFLRRSTATPSLDNIPYLLLSFSSLISRLFSLPLDFESFINSLILPNVGENIREI